MDISILKHKDIWPTFWVPSLWVSVPLTAPIVLSGLQAALGYKDPNYPKWHPRLILPLATSVARNAALGATFGFTYYHISRKLNTHNYTKDLHVLYRSALAGPTTAIVIHFAAGVAFGAYSLFQPREAPRKASSAPRAASRNRQPMGVSNIVKSIPKIPWYQRLGSAIYSSGAVGLSAIGLQLAYVGFITVPLSFLMGCHVGILRKEDYERESTPASTSSEPTE